ncbi:MAG: TrmH family RNA methyltransferase [Phycisphaeraceae bacterium]
MPRPVQITSLSNPRLKQVTRLREHRHRRKTGLLIAEGHREVSRALAAGLRIRELWTSPELLTSRTRPDELASLLAAAPDDALHAEVPAKLFRKIAYVREPEGLLAVAEQPHWSVADLPPVGDDTLYLVAVGVAKPGNLGAMVRSADAAGCQAVFAAGTPVDAFNPNAIRTSTGAVFSVPVLAMSESEAREHLEAAGVRLALATLRDATPHTQFDWRGPVAIVIGPEDLGLSDAWYAERAAGVAGEVAGEVAGVKVAMRGRTVDSLNASNAAAVLLFEALRQRAG